MQLPRCPAETGAQPARSDLTPESPAAPVPSLRSALLVRLPIRMFSSTLMFSLKLDCRTKVLHMDWSTVHHRCSPTPPQVLGRCCHPNIVRLLAACLTPPKLCLVMELMDASLEALLYGGGPERQQQQQRQQREQDSGPMPLDKVRCRLVPAPGGVRGSNV